MTGLCEVAQASAKAQRRMVDVERLCDAATHWLRHSYAKGLDAAVCAGLDARGALANMSHRDMCTFNQYVDDEPTRRTLATAKSPTS